MKKGDIKTGSPKNGEPVFISVIAKIPAERTETLTEKRIS